MSNQTVAAMDAIGEAIISSKDFLTTLDTAIGDSDHGINMARGFEAVSSKLRTLPEDADIGMVLKTVAMTLISTVGGASGPLYGTAFLRAAAVVAGKKEMDGAGAAAALAAAIQGIKERGKATTGEKTMLDALEPALAAFNTGLASAAPVLECLNLAVAAAEKGVEYTKTIIATKGRASYLGERSLGHQDPGATSATIMLTALASFCRSRQGVA